MSEIPLKDEVAAPAAKKAARQPGVVRGSLLRSAGMVGLAVPVAGALWYVWRDLRNVSENTEAVAIAGIVGGVGMTVCLAGAMHFLDVPLVEGAGPRWYVRWPLKVGKRVLLVLELLAMGLALGAAGVLVFGFKVPGAG